MWKNCSVGYCIGEMCTWCIAYVQAVQGTGKRQSGTSMATRSHSTLYKVTTNFNKGVDTLLDKWNALDTA